MITSSPSPTLHSSNHSSPSPAFSGRSHYDAPYKSSLVQSSSSRSHRAPPPSTTSAPFSSRIATNESARGAWRTVGGEWSGRSPEPRRRMVDASTQYSPQPTRSPSRPSSTAESGVASLQLEEARRIAPGPTSIPPSNTAEVAPQMPESQLATSTTGAPATGAKRSTSDVAQLPGSSLHPPKNDGAEEQSSKRARPTTPAVKLMPMQYETCNVDDLVIIISSMLMELIRYNDDIPLRDGRLTRFHSRAPPGISVRDYLQRLATHATLPPPILLSMVYYIDKLCALYPAFTISSLTVHRFLITSATVASKGLSDSFWTNRLYARVGGVSLKELALLELEFLWRVEWRIVPRPEVLVDYYRSLVERSEGYQIDITGKLEENNKGDDENDKG